MKILFILMFVVLILAAVAWWRALMRNRTSYIDDYPYARFLDKRLAARRPELSAEQRALVFSALRDYFHLCRTARRRMVSMPSQAVDDAWHEFILFTRNYRRFCSGAFGRFLHHTPAEAMRTPTQAQDGIKRAWRLACAREGIDAKAPDKLPLLFALDAMLGISGGFVYQLDCMAATQAGVTAGSGYCASHIGCGGGCGGSSGDASSDSSSDGGGCGGGCGGGD